MLLANYIASLLCVLNIVLAMWPQPVEFEHGSKVLWLSPGFKVHYKFEEPAGILGTLQSRLMYVCYGLWGSKAANERRVGRGGMNIPLLLSISLQKTY